MVPKMLYFLEKQITNENYQDFDFLKHFYGKKGNYITIVKRFGNGKFPKTFSRLLKKQSLSKATLMPTYLMFLQKPMRPISIVVLW